jgi:hypothetical protein
MRQAYQIALIIVKFQSEYNPLIDNALEGPRRRMVQAIFCLRRRHQPRRPPLAKIRPKATRGARRVSNETPPERQRAGSREAP